MPRAAALAHALAGRLADPRLGGRVLVDIADATTGAALLRRAATTTAAPASTAKLATAAAVLATHRPTDRLTTRVVAGATPGTVVLVGGGDPTLSAATGSAPGSTKEQPLYADAARIADLAAALRGVHVTRVVVDTSLFTGPAVSPGWAAEDVPSDYAAPITAAMVDGGRDTPGAATRGAAPAEAAGRALATALGVPKAPVSQGIAPAGARVLASVRSAPVGELVRQMLQASDNVIAESLARQVALAEHRPATFAGAASAVREVVRGLGVDIGIGMRDGSGLAATDRISPEILRAGYPVEHLMEGTSTEYRAERRRIIDRFYDVRPRVPGPTSRSRA